MSTAPAQHGFTARRAAALCIAAVAAWGGVARADGNIVARVEAKAEAERTTVIIHGSATPSFTAYRLEKPSRLVVDVANGQLAPDVAKDGLVEVDSWAVSQIATAQYHTDRIKTARVMIGLKRGVTYDARPKGNDLYVTVTATDPAPAVNHVAIADVQKAKEQVAQAESRRTEVLAQLADEEKRLGALKEARAEEERREKKQGDAVKAEADATRRAESARADADTAKARAVAARAEVEHLQIARAAEEQKIAELQRRAAAGGSREQAELDALRKAADQEQARLTMLKAEAEKMTATRTAELKKVDDAQAEARRALDKKQKSLEEARVAADQRAQDAAASRMAEERRVQARLEESARMQASAQKLATSEAQQKNAEAAATKAAERARLDEQRVAQLRIAGDKIAHEAEVARAQVEAARLETQKLVEAQAKERGRLENARLEAKRLADQRQLEMERAAHASAMVSGQRAKMEAAESEARRLADLRQKESQRLDAIKKSTGEAAALRAEELARIDAARASQKATVAAHERELKALAERRDREMKSFAEARAGEEQKLGAARTEAQRARTELAQLEAQRDADKAALAQLEKQLSKQRDADRAVSAAAEKARAELAAQKNEASRTRAEISAQKDEASRTRAELSAQKDEAARARAEVTMQKDEAARARAEVTMQKDQASRARAELLAQKDEAARARAELSAQKDEAARARAEHTALEKEIADAKAELARAEERTKLASVKMPAKPAPVETPVLTGRSKELARTGQRLNAQVRDVRFADDADYHRIVIDVAGEPEWRTTPSQKGELTLSLKGAELPRRLERTLDTAAYGGPVRAVSTFSDPNDASAVKVVVTLDPKQKGGEPRITKEGDKLVWEFPRETRVTSIQPARVGGYGASIPLQMGSASTNLPNPNSGQSRRRNSYSGRRIDLDFKDFDIHNILRLLSDVGQVNIITSDDVKGTITIRMRDVPWDQALDVILKAKGLGMQREGNLIRVAPLKVLEQEMEAELARAKASIELKPLDTRLIPLSYAQGEKMLPRVQELLSSRGKVSVDERTNMLIVSDVAGNIALAEDLVRNLDTQTPQVLIEARIVEASQNFTRQVGIQWGGNTLNSASTGNPTGLVFPSTVGVAGAATDSTAPVAGLQGAAATNPNYVVNLPSAIGTGSGGGLGITLGSLAGTYNVNLRLSALETTGQVRIVSAPKIMTLDNVEASIEQGTAIPISVVSAAGTNTIFVDAKLNLTVKPHVTNEGSVAMTLAVTRNEPDFTHVGARGDPTILKRQAKTEMLVRDGDTAVIGGIYTRNSGNAYQKLPWVADIPILGWLFKNRRENDDRTELLIFITPRIVNRQQLVAR